jgi:DNA (cytosine-5)-methyltransferase 1
MALNLISLFSGAGGLDLGFQAAGFRTRLAVDIMPEAVETLIWNDSNRPVFGPPFGTGDVGELNAEKVFELTGLRPGEIDMMVGGPPCQPFSVAAAQRFLRSDENFKRVGFESADKGKLIFRYAELIIELRPKAFLIENVPGILSIDGGTGISVVYDTLSKAGYTMSDPFVLNAMNYGVPQSRKRAFVIGTLSGKVIARPDATHWEEGTLTEAPQVTVCQALLGVDRIELNNTPREHRAESIARYREIAPGKREALGRVDRLDPNLPSKTVIAGGTKGGGRSHLHPFLARTLSVRECARLQTFPDTYEFLGKNGRQFTLVGNAVPPLLAEVLARQIGQTEFGLTYEFPLVHRVQGPDAHESYTQLLAQSMSQVDFLPYADVGSDFDARRNRAS